MNLISWGINHKTAGVALREKLAFGQDDQVSALNELGSAGIEERLILSTCNRTEIYAWCKDGHPNLLKELAVKTVNAEPNELAGHDYTYMGLDVANHLFRVTSSLDSMVIGEPEIVNQVKKAYKLAQDRGAAKKVLNALFQRGFSVAKRVRTETNLASRPTSVGSVAASLAVQIFGAEGRHKVLVLGAGEMAEVSLQHLMAQMQNCRLTVCNRSIQKAEALAETYHGSACDLTQLSPSLIEADVVLCSLSTETPFITQESLSQVIKERRGRPIFMIDIGVPRNVASEVNEYDEVFLYDMDDLQKNADENMRYRESLIDTCEPYIVEGVNDFKHWLETLSNQDIISDIMRRNEELIREEFSKSLKKLGEIDEAQEKEILYLVRRVLNKVMHHPIHSLRQNKQQSQGKFHWRNFFLGNRDND